MTNNEPLFDEILGNVDKWLTFTKGWFHPRDIWHEYNISEEATKQVLRDILQSKHEAGELDHEEQKYRLVDRELREIDWFNADEGDYIHMRLPFNLDNLLKLFPGVVVIAGEKGKGKSAWLMDCIFKNISIERPQHYFVSDAQDVEIKERFLNLLEGKGQSLPDPDTLKVYERHSKFGDVIVRDGINYVDYLDMNSDFYQIGQEIDDIGNATGKGVTFIALQKNPKEKLGVGGVASWKRAQVYITLAEPTDAVMSGWFGELKLLRTRGRQSKFIDPTGMKWGYWLKEGHRFMVETKTNQAKLNGG